MRTVLIAFFLLLPLRCCRAETADVLARRTCQTLKKATAYLRSISTHGGYVGIYSPDLKQRYGEALYEKAKTTEIWVQPPGTPSVGEAFLRIYRLTNDKDYLSAAREVGRALAWGQRAAGGWDHRVDVSALQPDSARPTRQTGRCTFDDNITQGALSFLMNLDQVLDEPWLREAVELGLQHLLRSQFPNGAWPQWFPLRGRYHDYYTFNDRTINDCIRVLLRAHRLYGKEEYLAGARRGGDFIILSQISENQSGWAQQYSHDLKPARARSFEPPAVCSVVTARNIKTLVDLYLYTKDQKYLKSIPAAIEWLNKSQIKPDLWARFYELDTNRPIYGDRDGKIHYKLDEVSPERQKGYSWQGSYGVKAATRYYQKVKKLGAEAYSSPASPSLSGASRRKKARTLEPKVKKIIENLDDQGRWINQNMIHIKDFVRNFNTLCDYLELTQPDNHAAR